MDLQTSLNWKRQFNPPASLLCDFYKVSHRSQYPKDTEVVYSTWTPRTSRIATTDRVVCFGVQFFVLAYLCEYFNRNFFDRALEEVLDEYSRVLKNTLGVKEPDVSHIIALHRKGYLPVRIKAVPEGTLVPIRCPMVTIENTEPGFFWLTNYLETLMSCTIWLPMTSATAAFEFRKLLNRYAKETDAKGQGVPPQFQGHDFSMRGMGSLEDACKSGAGHLTSFVDTDTIPAIAFLEHYYLANIEEELVGTSIPATEHSVMCAHGKDELETFRHLLTNVYPTGYVSVVSDTWNLWDVLTKTIPALKDTIMKRDGKLVIRPDSGDPVKIVCGDPQGNSLPERAGVIKLLWEIFGGSETGGYRVLNKHIGCIYGDAITYDRCERICQSLKMNGFASTNMVYGIGSFTYQYVTRDTFGFALKSTYSRIAGKEHLLFKDPVTDPNAVKKSQKGRVVVLRRDNGEIYYIDELYADQEAAYADKNLLQDVYCDGRLTLTSLADIRKRLAAAEARV